MSLHGQIGLIAYGSQNAFFNCGIDVNEDVRVSSGNPVSTFFSKVFRRHTHFAQESIDISLEGPNLMMMDTPIKLRANITRNADLITDLVLVFDLPDIYSKLWSYSSTKPNPNITTRTPSFRWIQMLGAFIIDTVSITISGSQIQSFPGEWIAVRASTDMTADRYAKWCSLVGHVPELYNPEWGVQGRATSFPFQRGGYPHAVADPTTPATTPIAPSIVGRQIRVPIPFWFTESWGTALPLVALQKHFVEVQIQLRTLREVYRLMDDYFQTEPMRPGRRLQYNPALPTLMDASGSTPPVPPYTNLTLQANYQTFVDASGNLRNFFTDPTATSLPRQDGFIMNAHLEANYVYLTNEERHWLASRELSQLVHQVQTFQFPSIVSQQLLRMDVHGLLSRLVFFGRRTDAITSRNDYLNLSNWKYSNQAPYWPLSAPTATATAPNNSGQLISYAQRDILRYVRLILGGNEYQVARPAPFFEVQVPFMNTTGTGAAAGLNPGIKPDAVMGPLYQMCFAVNASDHVTPSGSLNTSTGKTDRIELEVTPWDLDPYSAFAYDFTVYAETMNIVKILSGMGGLAFAI